MLITATFGTENAAEHARQALLRYGADATDMCELAAGETMAQTRDRALLVVQVGGGHVGATLARSVMRSHEGHFVRLWRDSPDAMSLLRGLRSPQGGFRAPETIMPALVLAALVENEKVNEQPDTSQATVHERTRIG